MRIDAHVHAFPDRLALKVREALNRNGTLAGSPLLPAVAEGIRASAFDRAWILPYAHRAGIAEAVNEWSAAEVSAYPWLIPGATFHPDDEDFGRLVERALVELRLRVVKLHCSVGNFAASDPRLEPLWATAERLGVPIVTHAGHRSGGATEPDELDEVAPVLKAHPDLRFVLAHAGHPNTAYALELMERFDNLRVDVTPVWLSPIEVTAKDVERFAGRMLFGSDAPNCPQETAAQVARFTAMEVSPAALEALLGGTAAALAG